MKLTQVILIYKSMFPMKNIIKSTNILYTGSHKCFSIHYIGGRKFLKCVLTYLYFIKYNEIHMHHLDSQKHPSISNCINSINILHTDSCKRISIYYA